MTYTDEPMIEIRELEKSYGDHRVLSGLNLALPQGVHALLGPNGAGKTTLVNILSTLIPFDSGSVRVLGLDPRRDRRALQSRIALTGQYAAVDEALSGLENMHMMGELFGLGRRGTVARSAELLERFELAGAARRRVGTYSGGMRRKLDIAVCLLAEPQLIFLDEPTTGLDTRSRQALWEEIAALARAGTSVLLTTQYLDEADALADRIMVLDDGRIAAEGTAAELKSRVGGATVQLLDRTGRGVEEIPTGGGAAELAEQLAALAADRPEAVVTVRRPSLDDVFLQLTGASEPTTAQDSPEPATTHHRTEGDAA